MPGMDLRHDRELPRLGVERRAVVKADALAQLERVVQPVLADRPRLRQPRHDLRALFGKRHERLDDAPAHAVGVEVRHLGRIEVDGLGHESDDEGAGLLFEDLPTYVPTTSACTLALSSTQRLQTPTAC